jgi:hypothetical protein
MCTLRAHACALVSLCVCAITWGQSYGTTGTSGTQLNKGLVRVLFSSTAAVFGPLPLVTDDTKCVPLTTYGTTKAMCELLLNDYSRKGFVDGRAARLPTVLVRPGKPNAVMCMRSLTCHVDL